MNSFRFELDQGKVSVTPYYLIGHTLGESYRCPSVEYSYINIPKNASSECKELFEDWEFGNYLQGFVPTKEYLVILRDPTERWVSGMTEYLVGKYSSLGRENIANGAEGEILQLLKYQSFQNLIFDTVIFDSHTLPQCVYIQHLPINKLKFFEFNETVVSRIADYLNVKYLSESINQTNGDTIKTEVANILTEIIKSDVKRQQKIDSRYMCDHKLFDNIIKF